MARDGRRWAAFLPLSGHRCSFAGMMDSPALAPALRGIRRTGAARWRASVQLGLVALALPLLACTEPPRPRTVPALDKRHAYGDASLMPTRESEHSRKELVLAAELANAIRALHRVEVIGSHVTLPSAPRQILGCSTQSDVRARVLLILACKPSQSDPAAVPDTCLNPELSATIDTLARSVIGPHELELVWTQATQDTYDPSAVERTWNTIIELVLALALGASIGMAFERRTRATSSGAAQRSGSIFRNEQA